MNNRFYRWGGYIAIFTLVFGSAQLAGLVIGVMAPFLMAELLFEQLQGSRRGFRNTLDDALMRTLVDLGCVDVALAGWFFRHLTGHHSIGMSLSMGAIGAWLIVMKNHPVHGRSK